MTESPYWETPQWKTYERRIRRKLIPMIRDSAVTVSIIPSSGEPDVKFAVELGVSIMLDKPIIALVMPGSKIPNHLARVADHILEVDLSSEAGSESARKRLSALLAALDREGSP